MCHYSTSWKNIMFPISQGYWHNTDTLEQPKIYMKTFWICTWMKKVRQCIELGSIQHAAKATGTFTIGLQIIEWKIHEHKWKHQDFSTTETSQSHLGLQYKHASLLLFDSNHTHEVLTFWIQLQQTVRGPGTMLWCQFKTVEASSQCYSR